MGHVPAPLSAAGYVVPSAGFVAPRIIWQLKKADLPEREVHGKMRSCIISYGTCGAAAWLLSFVRMGVPLVGAPGIAGVVFPIVGGIKAIKARCGGIRCPWLS